MRAAHEAIQYEGLIFDTAFYSTDDFFRTLASDFIRSLKVEDARGSYLLSSHAASSPFSATPACCCG
jgi:hypothetical protein